MRSRYLAAGLMASCLLLGACGSETAATTSVTATTTGSTSDSQPGPTTTLADISTTVVPATAATTSEPRGPLSGRVVVIDPGHNGNNHLHLDEINRHVAVGNGTKACNTTGTSGNGYTEALFNWELAGLVVPLVEEAGATVLLTRHDNEGWGPCVDERAAVGNQAGADAVVSLHADGGGPDGRGFHVIHPASIPGLTDDIYEESYRFAVALHAAVRGTGMPIADYIARDGFSERDDLGGLNLSDIPAVFLEAGNMRNSEDLALLRSPEFQQALAEAIVVAIVDFLSAEPQAD